MIFFGIYLLIALGGMLIPNKKVKKLSQYFRKHYLLIFALTFFAGVSVDLAGYEGSELYQSLINCCGAMLLGLPIHLILRGMKYAKEKKKAVYGGQLVETLSDSAYDRRKIVADFNRKYGLNLTETQIDSIVGGSYQSQYWYWEIQAMGCEYDSIASWYSGDRAWLRAYLKAFNVQNISSDFEFQWRTCLASYQQIFTSLDMSRYYSIDQCIADINHRFLTNFDDVTFMIAYRFLQQNGVSVALPTVSVLRVDEELANLANKYEEGTPTH